MSKVFGFNDDELKLLLVAVRHMRRTFEQARKGPPSERPTMEAYAALYEDLFKKLLDMTGPVPDDLLGS
jgi:hypothetical protein